MEEVALARRRINPPMGWYIGGRFRQPVPGIGEAERHVDDVPEGAGAEDVQTDVAERKVAAPRIAARRSIPSVSCN